MITEIDNTADTIDSRDVIARIEELETELQDACEGQGGNDDFSAWVRDMANNNDGTLQDAAVEYLALYALQAEAEQYAPDWEYGAQLIRHTYFEEAMDELLEDIGALPKDLPGYLKVAVDYDALKMDYTEVDFDGVAYLIR